MNCITLVGRAGRDPEARYFESGTMVANVSLAVKGRGRDAEPEWFNLEIWGKNAQIAVDYVRRGSLIGVTGSVKTERWTDQTSGKEHSKTVVTVDRLDLLSSRRDDGSTPSAPAAAAPTQPVGGLRGNPQQGTVAAAGAGNSGPSSDDIPF